jgi:prolyl 4-hydroxylase
MHHNEPRVFTIDNFLSADDCSNLIAQCRWRMARAKVVGAVTGQITEGRTGSNCWLRHYESPTTFVMAQRLATLVNMPLTHAEGFQCLYYDKSQEYRSHFDSYPLDGSEKSERVLANGGQRIFTAIIYLNEPRWVGAVLTYIYTVLTIIIILTALTALTIGGGGTPASPSWIRPSSRKSDGC